MYSRTRSRHAPGQDARSNSDSTDQARLLGIEPAAGPLTPGSIAPLAASHGNAFAADAVSGAGPDDDRERLPWRGATGLIGTEPVPAAPPATPSQPAPTQLDRAQLRELALRGYSKDEYARMVYDHGNGANKLADLPGEHYTDKVRSSLQMLEASGQLEPFEATMQANNPHRYASTAAWQPPQSDSPALDGATLEAKLLEQYSIGELRDLTYDLDGQWQPGPGAKPEVAGALLERLGATGQTDQLSARVAAERPIAPDADLPSTQMSRRELRQFMTDGFTEAEVTRMAYHDLGLSPESLAGDGHGSQVRELLRTMERRGQLTDLEDIARSANPDRFDRMLGAEAPLEAPLKADLIDGDALQGVLNKGFNIDDMRNIAYDFGVDYEMLVGPEATRGDFATALTGHMQQSGKIEDFVGALARENPSRVNRDLVGPALDGTPAPTPATPQAPAAQAPAAQSGGAGAVQGDVAGGTFDAGRLQETLDRGFSREELQRFLYQQAGTSHEALVGPAAAKADLTRQMVDHVTLNGQTTELVDWMTENNPARVQQHLVGPTLEADAPAPDATAQSPGVEGGESGGAGGLGGRLMGAVGFGMGAFEFGTGASAVNDALFGEGDARSGWQGAGSVVSGAAGMLESAQAFRGVPGVGRVFDMLPAGVASPHLGMLGAAPDLAGFGYDLATGAPEHQLYTSGGQAAASTLNAALTTYGGPIGASIGMGWSSGEMIYNKAFNQDGSSPSSIGEMAGMMAYVEREVGEDEAKRLVLTEMAGDSRAHDEDKSWLERVAGQVNQSVGQGILVTDHLVRDALGVGETSMMSQTYGGSEEEHSAPEEEEDHREDEGEGEDRDDHEEDGDDHEGEGGG